MDHKCRKCGDELTVGENWYPSLQKAYNYICKECHDERNRLWQKDNPEKVKATWTRWNRKHGVRPFNENKTCSSYLGIHVAERVLRHVFKDVETMPYGNRGYDVICNHGKLIDIKSACVLSSLVDGIEYLRWLFTIERNTIADYFLCIAFDNRMDLDPLYIWLLPGCKFNHLKHASISPSTIHKWDAYRLDVSKVSACCDTIRGV